MEAPREYLEAIIQRTGELRRNAQLTQEEMSARLGLSRNTYAHYERIAQERLTILPIHLIGKFCEIVGCSPQYFLTGYEHPLLAAYRAISGQDKVIVDRFLGFTENDPLDPPAPSGVDRTVKQPHR